MDHLLVALQGLGLSKSASKVYLSALELGESTASLLARTAKVKRTTLYSILEELKMRGVVAQTRRGKRTLYIAEAPAVLLKRAKEQIDDFQSSLPELEEHRTAVFRRSRVYYLYGPSGFKQLWEKIFESKEKEFRIITQGENFLDYVKERYILNEIIKKKKELNIHSKQLISDSKYARGIIAKDARENRVSKILPPIYKLPFTEITCGNFVAFIAPRFEELIFLIEDEMFARTHRSLFEILWNSIR